MNQVFFLITLLFINTAIAQNCDSLLTFYKFDYSKNPTASCGEKLYALGLKLETTLINSNVSTSISVYKVCDSITDDYGCKFALFRAYYSGEGVAQKDYCRAFSYLRSIANSEEMNDHHDSSFVAYGRYQLAGMYLRGICIERDMISAYVWMILYNELRIVMPENELERNKFEFELLEEILSDEEIHDAVTLARLIKRGTLEFYNIRHH